MSKETSTHAQAAKEIRYWIKANYPGIKSKVTSSTFSMGNSVTVRLENPTPRQYQLINEMAEQHQYGHFNGMEDIYEHSNGRDDIAQVKFVSIDREFSTENRQACWDWCRDNLDWFKDAPVEYDYNARSEHHDLGSEVWKYLCGIDTGYYPEQHNAMEQTPLQAVQAAQEQEHQAQEEDQERTRLSHIAGIKNVHIYWSENRSINNEIDKTGNDFTYLEAEQLLNLALVNIPGDQGGYDKTKICLTFQDGEQYEYRLDISDSESSIRASIAQRIKWYNDSSNNHQHDEDFMEYWKTWKDKYQLLLNDNFIPTLEPEEIAITDAADYSQFSNVVSIH